MVFSARRQQPRPPRPHAGRLRRAAAPLAAALLFGSAVALLLPAPVYRAVAVVAPEPGGAKNTVEMRHLADYAVSRPVLRAAADALVRRNEAMPLPGLLERLGLIHLDAAGDRSARLADQLADRAHAAPAGEALMIGAEAAQADEAARLAQALADAFLRKRAEAAAGAQRTREAELAARIAAAEATASAARKRFLAAGGADAGMETARAAAAGEIREAEGRIGRIRSLMASSSPPVADDGTATQAITDLQASYLDLQGKLAEALQTLGERHTTVITLRDSIRRTGSELTAAWTRQLRSAEADRDAAKARSAALFRNDPGRDPAKQAALEDARRNKDAADAALLRAEAELDFLPDQPIFALRSAAAVPSAAAAGWFPLARAAAAALAAFAAYAAILLARSAARSSITPLRRGAGAARKPAARAASMPAAWPAPANDAVAASTAPAAPVQPPALEAAAVPAPAADASLPAGWEASLRLSDAADTSPASHFAVQLEPAAAEPPIDAPQADAAPRFFRTGQVAAPHPPRAAVAPPAQAAARPAAVALRRPAAETSMASDATRTLDALQAAFRGLIDEMRGIAPAHGPIPTLMVASAAADGRDRIGSTDIALAIGEVAARMGLRVLLVEATRDQALLAAHVERERRPRLVGMRDGLRLVFDADAVPGLYLAPLFGRRAALVAALSRHRGAALVDDVAARFDLLILDGGAAASASRGGWTADRYLAVDEQATLSSSARFLAALGHPAGSLAGTVVDLSFVPVPGAAPSRRRDPSPLDLAAA